MAANKEKEFSSVKVKKATILKIKLLKEMISTQLGHKVTSYDALDIAISGLINKV